MPTKQKGIWSSVSDSGQTATLHPVFPTPDGSRDFHETLWRRTEVKTRAGALPPSPLRKVAGTTIRHRTQRFLTFKNQIFTKKIKLIITAEWKPLSESDWTKTEPRQATGWSSQHQTGNQLHKTRMQFLLFFLSAHATHLRPWPETQKRGGDPVLVVVTWWQTTALHTLPSLISTEKKEKHSGASALLELEKRESYLWNWI